jgi:hypothetical protein
VGAHQENAVGAGAARLDQAPAEERDGLVLEGGQGRVEREHGRQVQVVRAVGEWLDAQARAVKERVGHGEESLLLPLAA